jgi:hypothetical protein
VNTDEFTLEETSRWILQFVYKFNLKLLGVIAYVDTYETGRVVVTHSLGVTEGFKHRVSLYDLIFKRSLLLSGGVLLLGGTHGGEVRNYLLRVLSLSGTRLTAVELKIIFVLPIHNSCVNFYNGRYKIYVDII